ncbi:acylneuraminate cytidylyltransferase (plasmid) [Solidesulfovibrio carbinoliphilus subsp. oakridgensis]|uniref:Acylneuraminate cytidylyltransferase n=1 Tax=Solidesulfovibrio carbinoliphilus subsp. oakridgensis TaxID=694327 RepID=G7QE71_9BACT|nr:glycosyltransferase family protein [Solidesulfovibrio carbinoliphilus]EHJ45965.1 acylneuraminate cytidylyltransferase [Solidesulfovibrio carbinoliphilus subsp. oakridgensis]
MKCVAIVQARLASSRLPGKMLETVAGRPLVHWVLERAARAVRLDEVCLATSAGPADDRLAEAAARLGVPVVRGSLDDVLDRYRQAAVAREADVVVRLTGDCPFADPGVIDACVAAFLGQACDYLSNAYPTATFPDGLDVEVFGRETLLRAHREARLPSEREHVTPYVWKHPDRFRLASLAAGQDLSHHRWTVDEPRDLAMVRRVAAHFAARGTAFTWRDVLELVTRQPEIARLNADISRNEGYAKSVAADRPERT